MIKKSLVGYDHGKKLTGTKDHILVDTLGLIYQISVHPASLVDRDGLSLVLEEMKLPKNKTTRKQQRCFTRLVKILADGGYQGDKLLDHIWAEYKLLLEVVKKSDFKKFVVIPMRWIVERTFSWLNKFRRLSKDYEHTIESRKAFVLVASIRLSLVKITGNVRHHWKTDAVG